MRSPFQIWPESADVLHFGGGPSCPSPEEIKKQEKAQRQQEMAMQKMLAQMSKPVRMPEFSIPAPPKPVPVAPAPTQSSSDIEDASAEARRAAARRYGFLKTRFAGSTGGYMATPLGSSNAGGAAVLG